jgi:beta-lactamase class D
MKASSLPNLALLCGFILLASTHAEADSCTLVADLGSGHVLKREGDCERRNSPASTFKIALSLMGYDSGVLQDETHPAWPYRPEYRAWNQAWKTTTTPHSWLRDSVVWYSQVLTRTLGAERFKRYVDAFAYGNRDVRGDRGKNNGLTHAWLSSSLTISPLEQIDFLRRIFKRELPVSRRAQDMTQSIMPVFPLPDGWTAYGKTGAGYRSLPDGRIDRDRQFGWFVGWAKKGERIVLFARLIRDEAKDTSVASFRARDSLLSDLPPLLVE